MHIERTSPGDLTTLATDRGPVPMNIAAVLVVGEGSALGLPAVRALLARRLPRVPRLRQRIVRPPVGHGRPFWVDDVGFDLDRHLAEVRLSPAAAGREQLLRVVADLVCRPLPRARPLWSARWVSGLPDGSAAMVIVVHHVLADGLGGLAVLAALADSDQAALADSDQAGSSSDIPFPHPAPSRNDLLRDAWSERAHHLRLLRATSGAGLHGLRELGLTGGRPRLAPVTSVNRPTGPRRSLSTVTIPLSPVRDLARSTRSTVNDVLVTAAVGALAGLLRRRGEHPHELVVSVPISGRRETTADRLGNVTGVVPLTLPTTADPHERLARTAAISRARRGGPRASSAGPLGLAFRGLGRIGVFRAFIQHQRLVNTFVTNVRGPAAGLSLGGHPVLEILPVAVTPGNVGVTFDILSYAGNVCITVVTDPELVPDADDLTALLAEDLRHLVDISGTSRPSRSL